ncbi:hypothetical protein AOQ84DRAFT_45197 [Glonium stellatum]|uniref:Uncharacterized protein n=1 Tax=Glonium stellatum TaxID=574774 RepID=A0A8E2JSY3_9PEZI|nr:hypothetical protein AOQ84DRAFT_45197 [Glonium stellatum]
MRIGCAPCLHRGQSLHQSSSQSLGAGCARDAGSTQHDQARCRLVNRNRNFFSQFTPVTMLIRLDGTAFAHFRMAASRGNRHLPCLVYWLLLTLGETVHELLLHRLGSAVYARPSTTPRPTSSSSNTTPAERARSRSFGASFARGLFHFAVTSQLDHCRLCVLSFACCCVFA